MQGPETELTIVTAASSNHYRCLRNLLRSLDHHETAPVIVYDIGLTQEEAGALRAEGWRVERFAFERCPAFFGTQARLRRPCCWKPVLIHEVLEAVRGPVLWLDAGNLVHERLDRVRALLASGGFYSPLSLGDIAQYTHPQVLELLKAEPEILADRCRDGATVGFGRSPFALTLAREWRNHALREEIMEPPGWTKDRWRSDQAVLSVMVAQARRRSGFTPEDRHLGISTHNDRLSARSARVYMKKPPARALHDKLRARDRKWALRSAWARPWRRTKRWLWKRAKRTWRKMAAVRGG